MLRTIGGALKAETGGFVPSRRLSWALAAALFCACQHATPRPNAVTYTSPRPCPVIAPTAHLPCPRDAEGNTLNGTVRFRLHLARDGGVSRADVISSDDPQLEGPACQDVLALRFEATGAEHAIDYSYSFLDD